jgi:hypothetical protein
MSDRQFLSFWNIVLVLCVVVKGQGGKVRSKVHGGPTVLILLKYCTGVMFGGEGARW